MSFGPLDAEYAECKITHGSQSEIKADANTFHDSSEKKTSPKALATHVRRKNQR